MLVDPWPEVIRIPSECDPQQFQELVHAVQQRLRGVCGRGGGGRAFEHDDAIGEVRRHYEVVLHYEAGSFGVEDESGVITCLVNNQFPHRSR